MPPERWSPVPVVLRVLREQQQKIAAAIRTAAPRAPHRAGSAPAGVSKRGPESALRGILATRVTAPEVVAAKPWGGVLRLQSLGPTLLWFGKGTQTGGKTSRGRGGSRKRVGGSQRQPPRPLPLVVDRDALVAAIEADAANWLVARERGT